ncbi:MAG: trigger factor, partial [Burkholderiaceae bacterium]|nr:trigger factor [Burkholderiaceae bacterium]
GKAAEFSVTVRKVQQPVLPAIDADFAQSLGVADGDLAKMRAEVRANLEREVGARLKSRTRESALGALLASTTFEVPKSLVEEDKQRWRAAILPPAACRRSRSTRRRCPPNCS